MDEFENLKTQRFTICGTLMLAARSQKAHYITLREGVLESLHRPVICSYSVLCLHTLCCDLTAAPLMGGF